MALVLEDFSSREGHPSGWRCEGATPVAFEVRDGSRGRALRVAAGSSEQGPVQVVWTEAGSRGGELDLCVRLRWLLRGDEYAWRMVLGNASAGFETVRSAEPRTSRRSLRPRALVSRALARLRIGGRRPPPRTPPPAPVPLVRLAAGGSEPALRPFGTSGNGMGRRVPEVGEWIWMRLTRREGVWELRFWRDGFVELEEPWIRVVEDRAVGASGRPGADGLRLEPRFVLARGGQELEIDWAGLGTDGDAAPRPEPFPPAPEEHPAWYDARWTRRKRIFVPRGHFSGVLRDFPLFLDLSDDPEIRDAARLDGRDILFTAADGVTKLPHERTTHRRLLREQAVWTVWSDPRAVRHVGVRDRTYVTYYTANRGWWISALDHRTSEWEHHRLRSHEDSADGRWWDDHNNPAVTVRSDGRLVVAYNEHSTARAWVRISERPEDISAWGPEIPVTSEQEAGEPVPRYSYVDLYTLPDGTLWRHYRPRDGYGISRPSTFLTSNDGGETWSAPTRFFEVPTRTPYVVTAQRGNRIDFFCNEAHPNEYHRASIHHFYYDHESETYHRSDGSVIGGREALPVGTDEATLVYDGTTPAGEGWVHSVATDGKGGIAALFVAYAGRKAGRPDSALVHEYWYARWNGREWERHRLAVDRGRLDSHANQRYYAGGGVVDPENLHVVYLSLVDPDDGHHSRRLFRYRTPNGGRSWSRRVVSRGEGRASFRPCVPRNRHPSLPVMWLHGDYVNYYEYWSGLAVGNDEGPVLESEHYVRVPEIDPAEHLVLYVYYGRPDAPEQASPEEVWPESLLFRYRGSLGVQELGAIGPGGWDALTIEVNSSFATLRQVELGSAQPLLSNWVGPGRPGILLGRCAGAMCPEVRIAGPDGTETTVFDDLELEVRDHRRAHDPPRTSFLTVRVSAGEGVCAWLNGVRSRKVGKKPLAAVSSDAPAALWSNASPHDLTAPPWTGWTRSLRIHRVALPAAWIALAQRAEADPDFAARLVEEVAEPRRVETPA